MPLHSRSQPPGVRTRSNRPRGFSLMEVIVTLSLMAALAMISSRGLPVSALSSVANKSSAQTAKLELSRVRRMAIISGRPHGVQFRKRAGHVIGYEVFRRETSGRILTVENLLEFSSEVAVDSDRAAIEFTSEGSAVQSARIVFKSSKRSWRIDVVPVTGSAMLTELNTT